LDWVNTMTFDPALKGTEVRVGAAIGRYFNGRSGECFVSMQTLAAGMRLSERTVWQAIQQLKRYGYLLVESRDLGMRKDGRRVCGGKGAANVYQPAFEGERLAATNQDLLRRIAARLGVQRPQNPAAKVAASCDLRGGQRSQNSAAKVAASCDPTLTSSSKKNSYARDSEVSELWKAVQAGLARTVGEGKFRSWIAPLRMDCIEDRVVWIKASNAFTRHEVDNLFSDKILAGFQKHVPKIERVRIFCGERTAGPAAAVPLSGADQRACGSPFPVADAVAAIDPTSPFASDTGTLSTTVPMRIPAAAEPAVSTASSHGLPPAGAGATTMPVGAAAGSLVPATGRDAWPSSTPIDGAGPTNVPAPAATGALTAAVPMRASASAHRTVTITRAGSPGTAHARVLPDI
jgi:hypothetical protein